MLRKNLWKRMIALSFSPRQWYDEGDAPNELSEDSMMWVYRKDLTSGNFLVGFYTPDKVWHLDSEHPTREEAREQVHYLNGGEGIPEGE